MSCPYLAQVTMVFCRATPVKKLVPSDRLTTASTCEGDCYRGCPAYREALDRVGATLGAYEAERSTSSEAKKGAQS